jgi:hypothetical protein
MAKLVKERGTLRHRPHYTVQTERGYIVGRLDKTPDKYRFWRVHSRNHLSKKMEFDFLFDTFAEAKRWALEGAARWEQ